MNVQPDTDLSTFAGRRVRINGGQVLQVFTIRHGAEAVKCQDALNGGVWGDGRYEQYGDDWGGNSSFWQPYGTDLTIV